MNNFISTKLANCADIQLAAGSAKVICWKNLTPMVFAQPGYRHEICQNFTSPDFQARNFTPIFSPDFNSSGDKNTKKWVKNGEIYTAGKNFKLPPAVTAVTNLTSARLLLLQKRQSRPKYHRPNFMFISAGQLNHKQLTVSERISSTTRISLLRFQRHRFGK